MAALIRLLDRVIARLTESYRRLEPEAGSVPKAGERAVDALEKVKRER